MFAKAKSAGINPTRSRLIASEAGKTVIKTMTEQLKEPYEKKWGQAVADRVATLGKNLAMQAEAAKAKKLEEQAKRLLHGGEADDTDFEGDMGEMKK